MGILLICRKKGVNSISKYTRLFLDFDGTIVNTIKSITDLYNDDFEFYDGFKPLTWDMVNTWNFSECSCTTPEYINEYFNQKRFFDNLDCFDNSFEIIDLLRMTLKITIVSTGDTPNLRIKEKWIKDKMPYCKFIGVDLNKYKDKSHIDMRNSIFIDDCEDNLKTSNASLKICFGDEHPWNKNWDGIRAYNWYEIYKKVIIS